MAVVVDPKDVDTFLGYANEENLEAIPVAVVTEDPRLVLVWRGKEIVNISRAFLDTNGAHQETTVEVEIPNKEGNLFEAVSYTHLEVTPTPETEDKSEGETRENLIYDSEDNSKVEKTSDQKK